MNMTPPEEHEMQKDAIIKCMTLLAQMKLNGIWNSSMDELSAKIIQAFHDYKKWLAEEGPNKVPAASVARHENWQEAYDKEMAENERESIQLKIIL